MSTPADPSFSGVSVVIPVLNAAPYLADLFESLEEQEPGPPDEIILIDSNSTDETVAIASKHPRVVVKAIDRFSHGRSRNLGARLASGEIIAFLSQDARPENRSWLAELTAPFADPEVAAAYSRQVPWPKANPMEQFFLSSHFPPGPPVRRTKRAGDSLSLSKVFFSNVSSAVRRDVLLRFPFDEDLIMSEDQQLSRDLLEEGFTVVYCPESIVSHSHDYTLREVFRRYFDSVYSLTLIFRNHGMGSSVSMGSSYLGREVRHMIRHHPLWLPYYALYVAAKASGTIAGHFAEHLPLPLLRKLSLHSYHWDDR